MVEPDPDDGLGRAERPALAKSWTTVSSPPAKPAEISVSTLRTFKRVSSGVRRIGVVESGALRELLIADLALAEGVASARDVAYALQGYWERSASEQASVVAELRNIADVDADALAAVVAEVDRRIEEAGGDAHAALTRHGGLDRAVHAALGRTNPGLTRALADGGVISRAPLRRVDESRYVGFEAAGEGGMGLVYAVLDTDLNRMVAFKMIRPDAAEGQQRPTPEDPVHLARPSGDTPASEAFDELEVRFLTEATITGGLEHPGIVPVYEIGQTPTGIPYYTMRFIRGQRTLDDALEEAREAPLESRLLLLEPFLKLCDAIGYAHSRDVIHRDIKPNNVALGQFGEVVVLDWGLAKYQGRPDHAASRWQDQVQLLRDETGLQTLGGMGTPGYMAPESARGDIDAVDERSDVYGLGAILYQIPTGRPPHQFPSLGEFLDSMAAPVARAIEVASDVPADLSALCMAALALDKRDRTGTTADLASALRAWQVSSAASQEVQGLLRDASAALDAADVARADARLEHVNRAAAALQQVRDKRPDDTAAATLEGRAGALRRQALREHERAASRRLLLRGGVAVLVLVAVAAVIVAGAFERKAGEARREKDLKAAALVEANDAKATLFAEMGREDASQGAYQRALALLVEAYRLGDETAATRLQIHRTLRHLKTITHRLVADPNGYNLSFSPDGEYLWVSGEPSDRIFSTRTWKEVQGDNWGTLQLVGVPFWVPGPALIAHAYQGVEYNGGELVVKWTPGGGPQVLPVRRPNGVLSPDRTAWAESEEDKATIYWIERPAESLRLEGRCPGGGLRWSGNTIVALGLKKLVAWAADTGAVIGQLQLAGLDGQASGERQLPEVELSPDGTFALVHRGRRIYRWDFKKAVVLCEANHEIDPSTVLSISLDSRRAVAVDPRGFMHVFSTDPKSASDGDELTGLEVPRWELLSVPGLGLLRTADWIFEEKSDVVWREDGNAFLALLPNGAAHLFAAAPLRSMGLISSGVHAIDRNPKTGDLCLLHGTGEVHIMAASAAAPPFLSLPEPGRDESDTAQVIGGEGEQSLVYMLENSSRLIPLRNAAGLEVWSLPGPEPMVELSGLEDPFAIALSPDGGFLGVLDGDGSVALWRTKDWSEVSHFETPPIKSLALAVAADGNRVAVSSGALMVYLLDSRRPDPRSWEAGEHVTQLRFCPGEQALLALGEQAMVGLSLADLTVLWRLEFDSLVSSDRRGHHSSPRIFGTVDDGDSVIVDVYGLLVRVDTTTGEVESTTQGASSIYDINRTGTLSGDRSFFVTVGEELLPRVYRSSDLSLIAELYSPRRWLGHLSYPHGQYARAAISRSGDFIACGGYDGSVTVWETTRYEPILTIPVSADGPTFATWFVGNDPETLVVLDETAGVLRSFPMPLETRPAAVVVREAAALTPWRITGGRLTR